MNNNQMQPKKRMSMTAWLNNDKVQAMLEKQVGSNKSQFCSDLISLTQDTNIAKCDPNEVMACAMNASALKLPLNKNLGYAYVIAYGGAPQFQIGYKGILQLAIRSGLYTNINVCDVREGEMKRNKFTGELDFNEEKPENEVIGFVAFFRLKNGFSQSLYMSNKEIAEHRDKFSKSGKGGKGVWASSYDGMAKKTVLKLLLTRWGILSIDMQEAITRDQTDANGEYNDNPEYKKAKDADFEEKPVQDFTPEEPKQIAPEIDETINFDDMNF